MNEQYPLLGEQITRLVRTLAAIKGWSMTAATTFVAKQTGYSTDMIHHWRQGKGKLSPETTKILAEIGRAETNLGRTWGESFLHAAYYPDTMSLLNKLWPHELRKIPCNLPTPGHTIFIGRRKELTDLLALLSPQYAASLISVDGIGGVGKTALVLEAIYRCLRASTGEVPDRQIPTFDAIIFVTAKQQYLTPDGLLSLSGSLAQRTLRDLFREIALTLDRYEITQAPPQEQVSKVRDVLSRQRTLLVVDNLETMEDKQEIMAFLYRLPPQVKVVITTRERTLYSPIRLQEMEEQEALNLIEKEAREKKVNLSEEQALQINRRIGGIPAALTYSIGQVAMGYSVETILARVLEATGDVARFCFEGSISPLRGYPAHTLLMAMALFPKQAVREAVIYAAGLVTEPRAVEEGLAQLQALSLVSLQDGRYRMLPLTREYALAELATQREFEREARRRWIKWYTDFTEENGGNDWEEWHIPFDKVEEEWENLLAVFDWCAAHEHYHELRTFWEENCLLEFARSYGHWDERLTWCHWLLQSAERRGDWLTAVKAMSDKGYILALTGQLEEAEHLLKRAWDLREHVTPEYQVKLAQHIARLRIYQRQLANAHSWLDLAQTLLEGASSDERTCHRRWVQNQYYHGLACYGEQDYLRASTFFQAAVEKAQTIGWQRAVIFAQHGLADTLMVQNKLDEAERLLQTGLPTAERNKDRRRTAYYQRSFAYLRQKQGQLDETRYYVEKALDSFERLGMKLETEEMRTLLQQLPA